MERNVPMLPNPQRDAAAVADVLRKIGFDTVTLMTNLGRNQMASALQDFAKLAESSDWAVVYFVARKWFGFNREWAAPLASGISICGVSAAIATGGAIRARPLVPVVPSSVERARPSSPRTSARIASSFDSVRRWTR